MKKEITSIFRNKHFWIVCLLVLGSSTLVAQKTFGPEALWRMGRISPHGIASDQKHLIYSVSVPQIESNGFTSKHYMMPIDGGEATEIASITDYIETRNLSPDGKLEAYHQQVKLEQVFGKEIHPDLPLANAHIYENIAYRHWDTWHDGKFNHVFIKEVNATDQGTDVMLNMPYHCPQKPFGGVEDYVWSPDGKQLLYVVKAKSGNAYMLSTNTDIFSFDLTTKATKNLTSSNEGYDTEPAFHPNGSLAWLSMARDGFEADKNDIKVLLTGSQSPINLTSSWDGTVNHFLWSTFAANTIYFLAPTNGTIQLFSLVFDPKGKKSVQIIQLTDGAFDITGIVGQTKNGLIVTRTDMNHAAEIFSFTFKSQSFKQLTFVNKSTYSEYAPSIIKRRLVKTTDNKTQLVWVIYPPDFDSTKKYPTLLYCQGGPQSALTQFFSFRWNFRLMASQGYIVVAPNRRGMPGHGVKWNEDISKDWGGQVMDDYIVAIDDISKESYVDKDRIGAVGASYGGYSVFYLAGMHQKRFKTFISHCGVFNLQSMYGTTEEVFFTDFDLGGPYWDTDVNKDAAKAYTQFNPIQHVKKWDTPIFIIQGAKDYRVPLGQGQEAFQAAQLLGIKSRFLMLPDENHWVLKPQNALLWQREFFKWLTQTL